jgi:chromosome segregation ATPase
MNGLVSKLTNWASIIGVIGAIGGGFYAWGEFNTRLDAIEGSDLDGLDLSGIAVLEEKVSKLENRPAGKDWSADIAVLQDQINDIAKLEDEIDEIWESLEGMIEDLEKKISKNKDAVDDVKADVKINSKSIEFNSIKIEEVDTKNSNPLGG